MSKKKSNVENDDGLNCIRNSLTEAFVEKVMKVLIEKFDKGESKSRYKFGERIFHITLEEVKPKKKETTCIVCDETELNPVTNKDDPYFGALLCKNGHYSPPFV